VRLDGSVWEPPLRQKLGTADLESDKKPRCLCVRFTPAFSVTALGPSASARRSPLAERGSRNRKGYAFRPIPHGGTFQARNSAPGFLFSNEYWVKNRTQKAHTARNKRFSKETRCRQRCTVVATGALAETSPIDVQAPPRLFVLATHYCFQLYLI
jgi:hypothetical protein